jgi:hypothetical protein
MSTGRPELVIRPNAPMRRLLLITLSIVGLAGLGLAFELGQYRAGYNVVSAMQERARLHEAIRHLQAANSALKARVIGLQTVDAGHAREDQVVARTIGDLQARVARQTEELAFYRAVVAEGAPAIGLRVGTVRVSTVKPVGSYLVDVSLVRAGKTDGMTTGAVSLTVDGQGAQGKPVTLDGQALAGAGAATVPYDFRYYQDLHQTVVLPAGFRPEHLTVKVSSSRKNVPPLSQTFPWSAVDVP